MKLFSLIYLFTFSSCSVYEDRADCPSNLILDFSNAYESIEKHEQNTQEWDLSLRNECVIFLEGEENLVLLDTLENYPEKHEIRLPRMKFNMFSIYGDYSAFNLDNGFEIPLGEQCPKIYLSKSSIDMNKDEVLCNVNYKKSYSDVCIRIKSNFPIKEPGFSINLVGNAAGYDVYGDVIKGKFRAPCTKDKEGLFHCKVPRQIDNSLKMEFLLEESTERETSLLRTFAIGEYINEVGYDWNLDDLVDVYIEVDYSITYLKIGFIMPSGKISFDLVL